MRILHIIPSLNIGGAERLVIDICQVLGKMDHTVKLVVLHKEGGHKLPQNPTFSIEYLNEDFVLRFLRHSKKYPQKLHRVLKCFNPDIIHSHLQEAEFVSRLAALSKDHKVAWFSHCHDSMSRIRPPSGWAPWSKSWYVAWYEYRVLRRLYKKNQPQHFLAISESEKKYFEESKGLDGKISLLRNAIDVEKFTRPTKRLSKDPLSLINVGSFQAKKNQAYLLLVLKHLKANPKVQAHLTCLGDGDLKVPFLNMSKELGVVPCVTATGNVSNVAQYLWKGEVYVHSAKYEPFGLVLVEAMAAGLPVIALDAGGNRDIVEDGVNGYLLPKDTNPKVFAEKIMAVWQDKELLASLQKGAIRTAAKYDIGPYCQKLAKLYEAALL